MTPVKVFVALSIVWAAVALIAQVVAARGGGRRDFSQRAGNSARGLLYIFTGAMTPTHKESIRLHPIKSAIGMVMHVGAVWVLIAVALLLVWPDAGLKLLALGRPAALAALAAGIYLFVRRAGSPNLRAMNTPDDYLAMFATCGLVGLAGVTPPSPEHLTPLLIYSGLLFIYLPLGKLRHAVFFFIARGDYGRRLGYRGVYPPTATEGK